MSDTDEILKLNQRLERLRELRRPAESRWRDAVSYVLPQLGRFDERFDSTATTSSKVAADGFFGQICSPNLDWFNYRYQEAELNDDNAASEYLDELKQHMVGVFHRSTFYDVMPAYIRQGRTIGTATMSIENDPDEQRILCEVRHPREVYLATDRYGRINQYWLEYKLTAEQAAEEFSRDRLSEGIRRAIERSPYEEFEFVKAVLPRAVRSLSAQSAAQAPWACYDWEKGGKTLIRESGFWTFPAPTWRPEIRARETYGYCDTDDAMPDILTVNQMMRSLLKMAHKAVDPPMFVPEEMIDVDLEPGGRTWYKDPARQVYSMELRTQFPVAYQMIQDQRDLIRKAYNVDYFLMLMHREGTMTAREVLERKNEKNSVLGAEVGRFETEAMNRIHERMVWLEYDAGRLPEPPSGKEWLMGQKLKVEYVGPLAQSAKETQTINQIMSVLQYAGVIMEQWPETKLKVKPEIMLEMILEAFGTPEKAIRGDREYKKMLQEIEQQQQMAQQAQAAAAAGPAAGADPAAAEAMMMGAMG